MSNLKRGRGEEKQTLISHYQKKKTKFIVDSSLPVTPGALHIKAKGTIFTVDDLVSCIPPTTNYTAPRGPLTHPAKVTFLNV